MEMIVLYTEHYTRAVNQIYRVVGPRDYQGIPDGASINTKCRIIVVQSLKNFVRFSINSVRIQESFVQQEIFFYSL